MIICISPGDVICINEADALSELYKESWSIYGPHCLKTLGNDTRITLWGHGNPNVIGDADLTPENLVADLLSFGLPKTVEIIDLPNCGVGEGVLRDNGEVESYAQRLYKLLSKYGRPDIKIYAFSNTTSSEATSEIILTTSTDASSLLSFSDLGTGLALYGLSPAAKKVFDNELKHAPFLSQQKKTDALLEQKLAIRKKIIDVKTGSQPNPKTLEALKKEEEVIARQHALNSKAVQFVKKEFYHYHHANLRSEIYTGADIRRTLNYNENFHTTLSTTQLTTLSSEQKSVIAILNNRIAVIKEEFFNFLNKPKSKSYLGTVLSIFQSPERKTMAEEITLLENFSARIKKAGNNQEIFLCLEEGMQNNILQTPENIKMAEDILKIFNINAAYLAQLKNKPLSI
jgi:hypothetical protein